MLTSTRNKIKKTVSEAILKGLSEDGGLFVFRHINPAFFGRHLLPLSYSELAYKVLRELIDDLSDQAIKDAIHKSYSAIQFQPDIVSFDRLDGQTILNLYHGKTFAFKDMALSILPKLMEASKQIQQDQLPSVILTATSGDTGSAALAGFSEIQNGYTIVLYPTEGVSAFQEMQMNGYSSEHRRIFAVKGNFDDCQTIVKELFQTVEVKNVSLSSANSINIGRLIPQIVYYVFSYLELVRNKTIKMYDEMNVTVPTGNFGNIYAAYLAKKMGVPIKKLIIASNQNNVLTEAFNEGLYRTKRTLTTSISPSMDILISSNLERYLFDLYNQDHQTVNEMMETLKKDKQVIVDALLQNPLFYADFATEEETYQTIKQTFEQSDVLIDPHTAVAKTVADRYQETKNDNTHMLVVSTANPYKFTDAMLHAFQLDETGTVLEKIERLERYTKKPADPRMKRVYIEHLNKIELKKEEAYDVIKKVIGEIDATN